MRRDEEDLTAQREAVVAARIALGDALTVLAGRAKDASKQSYRAKGKPDLDDVAACHNRVQRAGEALDMAVYDLHTASGEDG